ncbi:MAG: hypothetical protein RIR49_798, partial [Actinomycetota bacterium]
MPAHGVGHGRRTSGRQTVHFDGLTQPVLGEPAGQEVDPVRPRIDEPPLESGEGQRRVVGGSDRDGRSLVAGDPLEEPVEVAFTAALTRSPEDPAGRTECLDGVSRGEIGTGLHRRHELVEPRVGWLAAPHERVECDQEARRVLSGRRRAEQEPFGPLRRGGIGCSRSGCTSGKVEPTGTVEHGAPTAHHGVVIGEAARRATSGPPVVGQAHPHPGPMP